MRPRTGVVIIVVIALLGTVVFVGIDPVESSGSLQELWVSETPRDNQVNHHAVGFDPASQVLVAPVAEVPYQDTPITDSSCALVRLDPADGAVNWEMGIPASACFTHALTQPAIGDIDGDGHTEVAVTTTENSLVVLTAGNGSETFRVPLPSYGYGRPTMADLQPTPGREVVASDIEGNIVATTAHGNVSWRLSLTEEFDRNISVWSAPVVTDVDGDGAPEVVVGTSGGTVVLTADGKRQWRHGGSAYDIAVGDIGEDDTREVFIGSGGTISALDGATGTPEWQRDFRGNARFRTVADADGDGSATVFVGRTDGTVLALDAATGETVWTTTVTTGDDASVPPPKLANVTGGSRRSVVAVATDGTVSVLDATTGSEVAAYQRDVPIWTFATPADLERDGRAEVLVRYGDGRVVALTYED